MVTQALLLITLNFLVEKYGKPQCNKIKICTWTRRVIYKYNFWDIFKEITLFI